MTNNNNTPTFSNFYFDTYYVFGTTCVPETITLKV